jgi:hypothetical protein
MLQMKIGPGKMKITIGADHFFVFPEAVPATGADVGEDEADEIVKTIHIL